MKRIYRYRITTTSSGNLSIWATNGDVWITSARMDNGSLHREDIVCIHANGLREVLETTTEAFIKAAPSERSSRRRLRLSRRCRRRFPPSELSKL
jgi:ribulose-5-phosphate 4-epimerase/fuculose-1-phosphate aldolase